MANQYEITDHLTKQQLRDKLNELNKQYAGRRYEHTNGDIYEIYATTTMNDNGQSEWGFIYSPVVDGYAQRGILHTRSLREFLDGRFTHINSFYRQLEQLDLTVRAFGSLAGSGYTIEEISYLPDDELKKLKFMNDKIFNEIRSKIPYKGVEK